jgi:hypothetical protein
LVELQQQQQQPLCLEARRPGGVNGDIVPRVVQLLPSLQRRVASFEVMLSWCQWRDGDGARNRLLTHHGGMDISLQIDCVDRT